MQPNGTSHSDTTIIIKNNIGHYEIEKYSKDFLQVITIIVYCPPNIYYHTVRGLF